MNTREERMETLSTWISGLRSTIDHFEGRSTVLGIGHRIDSRDKRYENEVKVLKGLLGTLLIDYVKAVEK